MTDDEEASSIYFSGSNSYRSTGVKIPSPFAMKCRPARVTFLEGILHTLSTVAPTPASSSDHLTKVQRQEQLWSESENTWNSIPSSSPYCSDLSVRRDSVRESGAFLGSNLYSSSRSMIIGQPRSHGSLSAQSALWRTQEVAFLGAARYLFL